MADGNSNVVEFKASKDSALAEIRRQLEQGYALVAGARHLLADLSDGAYEDVDRLLDMAEDVLADREYIDRVHPKIDSQEADNG